MKEYFSHDYSTRLDDKIKKLIRKHGMLGYGSYWAIIEDLYNNANALRLDYDAIAYDLRIDESVVESIINDFELFSIDGDFFGSISVGRRIEERNTKSRKARESALSRWKKKEDDANALRTQSDSNAIKGKERKGKEIKEKNIYGDFIDKFNSITGKRIRIADPKFKRQLDSRIKEGFKIEEIISAIENCKNDKYHIENPKFLTPEFITRPDKLQKYLNNETSRPNNNESKIKFDDVKFH